MYDYHSISLSSFEMLALNVLLLSLIMLALYKGESRLDSDSPWAMLSLLAVFGISSRILLDPLPNIQPVTMLVLVVGIYFGGWRAIALAGVIAWTSNAIALGHGPWTLFQALGWGAVGLLGASLSGFLREGDRLMVGRLAFVSHTARCQHLDDHPLPNQRPRLRSLSRSWQRCICGLDGSPIG